MDQEGELPLAQISPTGLPVGAGVAEHAEQIVLELEGFADRACRSATGRRARLGGAPASRAPSWIGRSAV